MKQNSEALLHESKIKLREKLLALRAQIDRDLVEVVSQSIWSLLQQNADYKKSTMVAAFTSIRGEIDTYLILEGILAAGKKLALPHVSKDKSQLRFYEVKNLNHLTPGEFGILCPPPIHAVPMDAVDLMLVPGLAFDHQGFRLGFGKGYYDRILPHMRPDAVSIGLCYSFQVVDQVPAGTHDIPVKALLHEKGMEYCSS
jgi:5-formyltetrahydrofolate cyclo-ligase